MSTWEIKASKCSIATINPIRNIVDKIKRPENHALPIIDLALGDPSVFGNLQPHPSTLQAVTDAMQRPRTQGYTNSLGVPEARQAIAKFMQRDGVEYAMNDIIVASGASQAILLVMQLLCNPGDAFLIPSPGFPLYETILCHLGAIPLKYDLDSEKSWEINYSSVEALIVKAKEDGINVKGMLINNPGNPTGSNYSKEHLLELKEVLQKHKLPLIADEIYGYMLFDKQTFTPFASICDDIPVFTISGLAKQFLVPGWRIGWIAICDRGGYAKAIYQQLVSLTQVILGASTVIQHAIPDILKYVIDNSDEYYTKLNSILEKQATIITDKLSQINGLTCIQPQGAMYLMVKIDIDQFVDEIDNDSTFSQLLLTDQNCMVLPGSCFKAHNMVRIVFCAPEEKMVEFAKRIEHFCDKYRRKVE